MELKDYQQQTLDTLDRYLEALKEAHRQADDKGHSDFVAFKVSVGIK